MPVGRRATAAAVAVLLLGAGALLAAGAGGAPVQVPARGGDGEVWVVGIRHPRGDWATCFDDDTISSSLMTADLPTSGASATFTPTAQEANVRRLLNCLDRSLTSGTVAVTVTALPDRN